MSSYCDFDGPKVYRESEVVARKEHPCVECNAPILKGERHLRYSGMWEDYWDGGRQHLLCRDACVWIRDALNDGCIAFGELGEWWGEHKRAADVTWVEPHGRHRKPTAATWLLGARMYAMVRRRERLARVSP